MDPQATVPPEHAAFLAQLRVLKETMDEAERSRAVASQSPANASATSYAVPYESDTAPEAAQVAGPAQAADPPPHTSPAVPRSVVTSEPSVPAEPACAPRAAGAGAGPTPSTGTGSGVFRRGFAGIKTAAGALGVGCAAVSSAVARGVPAAASVASASARQVSKTVQGHKEAAMDTALRIALARGLENAGVRFVELLADDEDMPACARARMRSASEWLWSEVETEVMAAVLLENTYAARRVRALELERLEAETRELNACTHPLSRLRAHILYTLYPYDRSIWGQLRMAAFYPLMALELCPLWGVQPLFFLLLFLLRDKSDEFQLCQFILEFKGLQFVTLGALAGLMAGAQAQWCSTHGTCDQMGLGGAPGMHVTFEFELVAFVLNVLLTWTAFVLLPLSVQKGALGARAGDVEGAHVASAAGGTAAPEPAGPRSVPGLKGVLGRTLARGRTFGTLLEPARHVDETQRCCCGCLAFHPRRGGALRSLLIYDLVLFLSCLSLGGLACATSSGWRLRSWLSWCRVLYGLGSFPFVVFTVPPLDRVLLHAKPTAYDRHGRCVAPLSLRDRQLRHAIRAAKQPGAVSAAKGVQAGVLPQPTTVLDGGGSARATARTGGAAVSCRVASDRPNAGCAGAAQANSTPPPGQLAAPTSHDVTHLH